MPLSSTKSEIVVIDAIAGICEDQLDIAGRTVQEIEGLTFHALEALPANEEGANDG